MNLFENKNFPLMLIGLLILFILFRNNRSEGFTVPVAPTPKTCSIPSNFISFNHVISKKLYNLYCYVEPIKTKTIYSQKLPGSIIMNSVNEILDLMRSYGLDKYEKLWTYAMQDFNYAAEFATNSFKRNYTDPKKNITDNYAQYLYPQFLEKIVGLNNFIYTKLIEASQLAAPKSV